MQNTWYTTALGQINNGEMPEKNMSFLFCGNYCPFECCTGKEESFLSLFSQLRHSKTECQERNEPSHYECLVFWCLYYLLEIISFTENSEDWRASFLIMVIMGNALSIISLFKIPCTYTWTHRTASLGEIVNNWDFGW